MSTHKKIDIICIVSVFLAIGLTILLMVGAAFGILPVISQETDSGMFTANDLNADWDVSSATKITLSDKGSVISGNGAYVHDGNIYIAYAGHYVLSGELTNGSVIIDGDKSDKIWLLLDGVTIHCDDGAAIRVEQADKVFLTLADNTENAISSGARYDAEMTDSGVDGAIYSKDDLTINGMGTLAVSTEYEHGIVCNDDLVITGGNIAINAIQDGIHANDSVCIRDSALFISAGDDGITVSNDDETAFLYVESGRISITDCYEGLEAVDITIAGGTIDIMASDDGINASGSGENSLIRIIDGDIRIINPSGRDADGLDSNGDIYIEGGRVFISVADSGGNCAIDYGSENGGRCVVSGGTVIACGSSMMAEGFDADSSQGFLMYSAAVGEGTTISLEDSEGNELLSEEIPYGFSSVVLSTPELKVGDICTVTIDDVEAQITIDNSMTSGFGPGEMFGGGMPDGGDHGGMPEGQGNRDNQPFVDRGDGKQDERPQDVLAVDNMFEPSDGMEPPDRQEMQRDETRPRQLDREQINPGENVLSSNNSSVDTLILLGSSVLVLVIGLFVVMKIKH
ncbi:MAG: carbohydrate-binding domain-containing protein [Lachnospiraceae bacterium]|nr:carbohydrate-binding domain-containing protein [Lachnospiraceae bacterium]